MANIPVDCSAIDQNTHSNYRAKKGHVSKRNKRAKVPHIFLPYAVACPGAVMIDADYTSVARHAVIRVRGSEDVALCALANFGEIFSFAFEAFALQPKFLHSLLLQHSGVCARDEQVTADQTAHHDELR